MPTRPVTLPARYTCRDKANRPSPVPAMLPHLWMRPHRGCAPVSLSKCSRVPNPLQAIRVASAHVYCTAASREPAARPARPRGPPRPLPAILPCTTLTKKIKPPSTHLRPTPHERVTQVSLFKGRDRALHIRSPSAAGCAIKQQSAAVSHKSRTRNDTISCNSYVHDRAATIRLH